MLSIFFLLHLLNYRWCGYCRFIEPQIEEIVKESKGKIKMLKVDVEKFPELTKHFTVWKIPVIKLFYKGKMIERIFYYNY